MTNRSVALALISLAAALTGCEDTQPLPAPRVASPAQLHRPAPRTGTQGTVVTAASEVGASRFLLATQPQRAGLPATPALAARQHLLGQLDTLGLSRPAVERAEVARVVSTEGGTVVTLRQRVDGVAVHGADAQVLLRRDRSLVAISGRLHPGAVAGTPVAARFVLSPVEASARALEAAFGQTVDAGLDLSDVRVERVLHAVADDELVAAYLVEAVAAPAGSRSAEAYRVIVDAADGRVRSRQSLTASEAFSYRVFARDDGTPADGPTLDLTPHPTGLPDGQEPAGLASRLLSVESLNGPGDPWLPASATTTLGNNADAYTDSVEPNGFTEGADIRATTTGVRAFDRTYDLGADPRASDAQRMAALTQAFFTVNWLHDWWYDAGFDETAGNAQDDNLGRGGVGGDRLLIEVQDSADTERDNANMSTPSDGMSPRMQIYLWSAPEDRRVEALGQSLAAGRARFGPEAYDLGPLEVVKAVDGTAPSDDACQPLTNGAALSGKLALVSRGDCTFNDKTRAAEAAGAVGVLLVDNQASPVPPDMDASEGTEVTIPTLSLTLADGADLAAALPETARMFRDPGVLHEAALDLVVAHEWGHYLHHRLNVGCGNKQCAAMGEGWGDFVGLHTVLAEDDAEAWGGVYALSGYAAEGLVPDSYYFGLRRAPYTIDQARNGLTFKHIADGVSLPEHPMSPTDQPNSEVHRAGEVWALMLHEAYVALLRSGEPFDTVRRKMSRYVILGMALAPPDSTYTEQRDALLAAAGAESESDRLLLAEAFARRGAGSCAVSPAATSGDLVGVVESFVASPALALGAVSLDDSLISCDDDGLLDAEERGFLRVTVANPGALPLTDGQLTVTSSSPGVSVIAGEGIPVPAIAPVGSTIVAFEVELEPFFPGQSPARFDLVVTSPSACEPTVSRTLGLRAHYDDQANASTLDSVESEVEVWSHSGSPLWERLAEDATSHLWHGADVGSVSDTELVSPDLVVGAGGLTMSFSHRHAFEQSDGENWDGGVIELSRDGGATWVDVSTLGTVPYGGALSTEASNPLGGRQAFVGTSDGYPGVVSTTLDLGDDLAGETIRVRFRIATDEATGAPGWFIDNIGFSGLTNTPFHSVVNDRASCSGRPDASSPSPLDAGTVDAGIPAGDPGACGGCAADGGRARGGGLAASLLVLLGLALRRKGRVRKSDTLDG